MNFDAVNKDFHISFLEREVENLRSTVAKASVIQNIIELLYDVDSENELIRIMLFALPQVYDLNQIRYFHFDKETLGLFEMNRIIKGEKPEETLSNPLIVPIDFSGGVLTETVINQSAITIDNGLSDEDELSVRFNCDKYMILPLLSGGSHKRGDHSPSVIRENFNNELDYRKAILRSPEYPVIGAFWLDLSGLDDQEFSAGVSHLTTLFRTAGAILSEIRMVRQITDINEKIEKDLQAARIVQNGLLPSVLPHSPSIDVAARYLTEDQVGGDYYDVFELDSHIYGIMVADASGHGIPSALIMAMTKILLKTFAKKDLSPAETLELVNTAIVNNAKTNKFITGFYGILDTTKNCFTYTSAGHCPQFAIHKRTGDVIQFASDGMFIGMFPSLMVANHEITYERGDLRLILYTDGLTEATNRSGTMYGLARLINSAKRWLSEPVESALDNMLLQFQHFIRTNSREDDLTLMIIDI